ncbi:MAG: YceH family protein [Candidatus Binatia bacterium]
MQRDIQLDPYEARVFGVLIEKALTTPEQYPLSINAATNGANQKSNRDPVLSLEEDQVAMALERLVQKYLARKVFPANSRVEKYCHNGKDGLGLESRELAILAELLMRGPQTAGELRTRVSRMQPIESLDQLMTILVPLIERGFVQRLAPALRAERYVQLLSPDLHPVDAPPPAYAGASHESPGPTTPVGDLVVRLETLEAEIERLRQQCRALAAKLGHTFDT